MNVYTFSSNFLKSSKLVGTSLINFFWAALLLAGLLIIQSCQENNIKNHYCPIKILKGRLV